MGFLIGVPILYIVSFILSLYYAISGNTRYSSKANYFFISAFVLQTGLILSKEVSYASRDIENVLFMIALIISIGSYILIRPGMKNLYSLYVSPVAFIITVPLLFNVNNTETVSANNNILLISHILPNLLSHTILFIATIFSSMFLFQFTNIKNKKIKKIDRLPSISLIERINFLLVAVSFPFMTIGLVLGFILSKNQIGSYWFGTVSMISILSWSIVFILIILKTIYKISGYRVSLLTITSFITIIIGYIVMHTLELPSHNFLY
tara:strand:+ start:5652 stop:6446 length:795 start_codon:yes stop_codon:yes gene_type:complete